MLQGGLLAGVISVVVLMVSIIIHEIAHGYSALALGDKTAFYAGRLSINPIRHLDWFGSLLLPLSLILVGSPFVFGWAKPVPVNTKNLSGKYGDLLVSLSGPFANILLASVVAAILLVIPHGSKSLSTIILVQAVVINCVLAFFNLIPIPPLDGFTIISTVLGNRGRDITNFLIRYQLVGLVVILFFAEYIIRVPSLGLASLLLGL